MPGLLLDTNAILFFTQHSDRLIIIGTARIYDLGLVTTDARILAYPHVRTLS